MWSAGCLPSGSVNTWRTSCCKETCRKYNIAPDQLTIHADRGAPMKSKPVEQLLLELQVNRSHSRPRVSNDNPYSEAGFKTMKYSAALPGALCQPGRRADVLPGLLCLVQHAASPYRAGAAHARTGAFWGGAQAAGAAAGDAGCRLCRASATLQRASAGGAVARSGLDQCACLTCRSRGRGCRRVVRRTLQEWLPAT